MNTMLKFLKRSLCCQFFSALLGLSAGSIAVAQTRHHVDNLDHGTSWVGEREVVDATVKVTRNRASSEVEGSTQGRLLKRTFKVGTREFSSQSSGTGRARIRLAGRTIRDNALRNGVVDNMPSSIAEVASVRSGTLNLGGWVRVRAQASAGAGHQYTMVSNTRSGNNPAAHLSGPAQSWLVGTGQVVVEILWGLASGRVEIALEGFNTTLGITLGTERSTINGSSLSVAADTVAWRFTLKLRAELGGHTVWRDTLVDESGPRRVREVMGN